MPAQRASLLRRQAFARLATAILIAMLVILSLGWVSYNAELTGHKKQLHQHYGTLLQRLEADWLVAATQLRSRLEFTRIMEEPESTRWPKLAAYMNAQWNLGDFTNVLILDAEGRTIFGLGAEAAGLQNLGENRNEWVYLQQYGELFRVYSLPLWLGKQGEGRLLAFKPVSNALARAVAAPSTELVFMFGGRTVAESREDLVAFHTGSARYLRAEIAWPNNNNQPSPTLIVYRDLGEVLPWAGSLLPPLVAALFVAMLLWLSLGRWLGQVTGRVAALGRAAAQYRRSENKPALQAELRRAHGHGDEVEQTAIALGDMLEVIEARDQEQRAYLDTVSMLEEAVIELDGQLRIVRASPGWNSITHRDDGLGRPLVDFIHSEDVELLENQCRQLFAGEKSYSLMRLRLVVDEQHESWVECRLLAHPDEGGHPGSVRGVVRDITQTYLHEKQITHMALHDALTGLPNRALLEDRVKVALRLAMRDAHHVGICFIDLDNFKLVNDSLGHKAGDRLLGAVSERLGAELRSGDTLARWGGDEFVLLLPDVADDQAIRVVAEKVRATMLRPFAIEGAEIHATFSMGVATYPTDAGEAEALFSSADRAMFYAKAQGRNQTCFFHDMTNRGLGEKELYIQNRLASAIGDGLIEAWYQPIVDARSEQCVAVEVLARWHDAGHGWISPVTFIPMAENLGLIRELGQQILLASLDAAERWHAQGRAIPLAVNISKRQLFTANFADFLLEEMERRGLAPAALILEVTESVALTDVDKGIDRLQQMKQAGFRIAIDDFGTGYSSLSQLHEIRADELKIDISFVRRLHQAEGLSMVQAIISLARGLGLGTVAEGVEDAATAAKLCELGADALQGYHFGKPMPRDDFEHWLAERGAYAD